MSKRSIEIEESKYLKVINSARSSGENEEKSSKVKLVKRESLNEDVIQRQSESIERNLKKHVPLEQFSRHLLERTECGNDGSGV